MIEFENSDGQGSPKIREKIELDFSLSRLNELVLNDKSEPPKEGDPDYEVPHNFLVTL